MSEPDDVEAQLRGYMQSLPAERRPTRDRAARRERLLPRLRAHVTSERRRVQRRKALVRAAGLMALGGAGATALWLALPAHRPVAPASTASAVASASALTVLDGALWLRGDTGAHAMGAGESVALADITAFEAPADRPARVRVADIVAMTLAPGARARPMVTASAGAAAPSGGATPSLAIALERGRAHFEVRKLQGEHRFHVMTPDADVEVRGTVFDVALSPRADAPTCVSVDEGLVQVAKGMRTRLLARGQSWDCGVANQDDPAGARATTEAAAEPPARESGEPRRRAGARITGAGTKAKADPPRTVTRTGGWAGEVARVAPSDLPVQNQLFQAALSAERAGRADEAARLYRQLLARAPAGPLSAQARANLAAVTGARR